MERVVSSSESAKSHRSAVGCWIAAADVGGEEEEEGRDGAARVEADLLELVSSRASRDGGASSSDVVVVVEGCGDGRAEEAKPLFLLLKLQSKLRR